MARDESPILDRHTQESLGCLLRERLDGGDSVPDLPEDLETLLSTLRGAGSDGAGPDRPH